MTKSIQEKKDVVKSLFRDCLLDYVKSKEVSVEHANKLFCGVVQNKRLFEVASYEQKNGNDDSFAGFELVGRRSLDELIKECKIDSGEVRHEMVSFIEGDDRRDYEVYLVTAEQHDDDDMTQEGEDTYHRTIIFKPVS